MENWVGVYAWKATVLFDAILPVVASAIFLIGVSILIFIILNIFRSMRLDSRGRRRLSRGWLTDFRRALSLLAALVLIGFGNLTFWVNSELRLYSPVVSGVPLGTISIFQAKGGSPRLVYGSLDREGREALEVFPVHDATFQLEGERIQWSPRLRSLGLGDYFKLCRIDFFPQTKAKAVLDRATFSVEVRQGSTDLFHYISAGRRWLSFVQVDTLRTGGDATGDYSRYLYVDSGRIVIR